MAGKKRDRKTKRAPKVDKLDTQTTAPPTGKSRRDWKPKFLKAFRESANVRAACEKAKISRQTAYDAYRTDAHFAEEWKAAEEDACDLLELEARRRAYEGVEEPVFGSLGENAGSGIVGTRVRHSNTLIMFLLKAHRPSKYGDRTRTENMNLDVSTLNDQQLALLAGGAPIATVLAAASPGGNGTPPSPAASREGTDPGTES